MSISSECWSGQLVFLRGLDLKVSSGLILSIEDFNTVFSNPFSLPRHQKLKHGQAHLVRNQFSKKPHFTTRSHNQFVRIQVSTRWLIRTIFLSDV